MDVYEGVAFPVMFFLSTFVKLVYYCALVRVTVSVFCALFPFVYKYFIVIGILSLAIGTVAIYQEKVKRVLAYSSIANAGLAICALSTGTDTGVSSSFFFMISYVLVSCLLFGALMGLRYMDSKHIKSVGEFINLWNNYRWIALCLIVALLTQAGFPPTLFFLAKFFVLFGIVLKG